MERRQGLGTGGADNTMSRIQSSTLALQATAPSDRPFNADDTLVFIEGPFRRYASRLVAVGALCVYAAYLVYRAAFTMNADAMVFSSLVYFAEFHGFFALFFYFHQTWTLRGRRVVPPPAQVSVDVFVTTYNEDVDMLRQTLRAAVAMRYPHRTYVLDDGRRQAVRALAEEVGCTYITRSNNAHAKAGNWNNAFAQTTGELIATFDADHVPRPDFLERTLGFFRDPKVALIQVPQVYHNLDSVQHRVSWKARRLYTEQDAFFNLVMPGKDHWNSAFFCGTGAVLRRKALEPHKGILTGTITEDLHTSVVLHSEGWKSVYLNELLVTGLAPVDLKSFEVQRMRWAEGNLNVASFVNPVTTRGLSLSQRVSYVASLYHWTTGIPKAIYYLAPPWILLSGTFPIANFDHRFFAIYLVFLASLITSYEVTSRGHGRLLMDELFSMVSFFTLLRAIKRVFVGRGKAMTFEVTSKRGSGTTSLLPVLPHTILLCFSLLAISWSLMGLGFGVRDDAFGAGIAAFWTLYNVGLMLLVLKLGGRPPEKRGAVRFRAHFAVEARGDWTTEGTLGVTADLSEHGCSLLWPTALPVGAVVPLRVHFGPRSADWVGEVRNTHGVQRDGWHRHSLQFVNLTQADVDLINDSVFTLVVPDLFRILSQPRWVIRQWRRLQHLVSATSRLRSARLLVRLPGRVHHAAGSFIVTARDLSATGVSVSSPIPLAPGTKVELSMFTPGRAWHGTVSVARCESRPSRPRFETWQLGLKFEREQDLSVIEIIREWDAA